MDLTETAAPQPVVDGPVLDSTAPVSSIEAFSKAATMVSIVAILILEIAATPDPTPGLRAASAAALAIGFAAGSIAGESLLAVFLLLAPVLPAVLWRATGREGPALDLVWMCGAAGVLLRDVDWRRWGLPSRWRLLLGGWALTLSLAWPVLVARELAFDPRVMQDMGAINSWARMAAPQVVAWIGYVVVAQLIGLLWLEWLVVRFARSPMRLPRAAHALWIGTTVASLVAIYQGIVNIQFLNPSLWVAMRRASSSMLDGNAFGTAAAFAAPIAVAAVWHRRSSSASIAALLLMAINLAGLWVSGSRTAAVCAGIGVVALTIGVWRMQGWRWVLGGVTLALIGGLAVFAIGGSTLRAGARGAFYRLTTETPAYTRTLSALWDRFGYGKIAMHMVRDFPATGVGVGGFHYLAPDYWRLMEGRVLPPDNAQNWWRQEFAELGVLGAPCLFIWSLLIAGLIIRGRSTPSARMASATLRGTVIGLALASLFGVPTQNPFVMMWFFFAIAWLWGTAGQESSPAPMRADRMRHAWVAVVVLAAAYAAGHLVLALGPLSVAERASRVGREYIVGAYAPERNDTGQFRWTNGETRLVVPWTGQPLFMRLWAQHPDIGTNAVDVTVRTPCNMVFSGQLQNTNPVDLRFQWPDDQEPLDLRIESSRTWKPAAFGANDPRRLGVAVQTDFDGRGAQPRDARVIVVPPCQHSPSPLGGVLGTGVLTPIDGRR
jgi:hypothetical protein